MENEFGGCLYRTRDARNQAVAYEWMTAGGLNRPSTVDELLAGDSDPEHYARECADGWGLLEPYDPDDADSEPRFELDELLDAFKRFIEERPDKAG